MPTHSTHFKYILWDNDAIAAPTPVLFPPWLQHRAVAEALLPLLGDPCSAGFVKLVDDFAICHGGSDSLMLLSRPSDAEHISIFLTPLRADGTGEARHGA